MLKVFRNIFYTLLALTVLGIVVAWAYALQLEKEYQLDDIAGSGALWAMPARVYANPLEIYVGKKLKEDDLVAYLDLLGYRKTDNVVKTEEYSKGDNAVIYYAPRFAFWDGVRDARRMQVTFADDKVTGVENLSTLQNVSLERLNPMRIASIYPQHQEDRILVKLKDVPKVLIEGIIATEDRNFWTNPGIDPKGILRSVYVSLIKKSGTEGASTLTQQFIKNHYLTRDQTFSRKIKEMLMALVLERHATKSEILEGYLNEIYLGQDGQRAIHGFGLASQYYFHKKLADLDLHQIALLIALVREPGWADPHAHPEHALERRNFILSVLQQRGLIDERDETLAQSLPLDVVPANNSSERVRFPAFVDLVYRQLYQHYNKEDLTKQGLNIFTTLDPLVQVRAQGAVKNTLPSLEKRRRLKSGFLQGAAVVVDTQSAEVRAIVGSREGEAHGFNRALSAKRQIGSQVKPAVYLSALEYPQRYTLATMLDNSPLHYTMGNKVWSPHNYSKNENQAQVMLITALTKSMNVPTVRLALGVGLKDVVSTLHRVGSREGIKPYPSLALGAVQMTPLEIAQIFETYADGGFFQPLRTVREITTKTGEIVHRFDMNSVRAIEPTPYYLLLTALQGVTHYGTAASIYNTFPRSMNFAGKTGTTNDFRDSWFSGFSGNYLTVAWVGNDQNRETHLSGSAGGLPVWVNIMKELNLESLNVPRPDGIVMRRVNRYNGRLAGYNCEAKDTMDIPFIAGSEPTQVSDCARAAPSLEDFDSDIYDAGPGNAPFIPTHQQPPSQISVPNGGNPSSWFNN